MIWIWSFLCSVVGLPGLIPRELCGQSLGRPKETIPSLLESHSGKLVGHSGTFDKGHSERGPTSEQRITSERGQPLCKGQEAGSQVGGSITVQVSMYRCNDIMYVVTGGDTYWLIHAIYESLNAQQ